MIKTSQFLYQLWRDFSYSFCKIDNLAEVAFFFFLAFVFCCLRRNSPRKKLWLAVTYIFPAVLLVCFSLTQALFSNHCVLVFIPYFIGMALGNMFNASKKLHWVLVPIMPLLTYSAVIFWDVYPPVFYPFAEIVDEPLQDVELKMGQNVDYEIEMIQEDAWWNDSRIVAIRVRNDSVFYRAAYRMCSAENIDDDGYKKWTKPNIDSVQWTLLSPEKSLIAKSLKNSIEKYEQEYHSDLVWDGYSVNVSLKDYKRKTSRRLDLGNASILGMQGAMVIEEMMFDLMPPRETFTTLSYDKVSKKCAEIENARIQQIEASRNSK
jgi:hypothetical protein